MEFLIYLKDFRCPDYQDNTSTFFAREKGKLLIKSNILEIPSAVTKKGGKKKGSK